MTVKTVSMCTAHWNCYITELPSLITKFSSYGHQIWYALRVPLRQVAPYISSAGFFKHSLLRLVLLVL